MKWLPFKNRGCIDLIIHVSILGAYVHICGRHEVSMIKPMARRTVYRWWLHRLISIYTQWATELTFHFANVCTRSVEILCVCLSSFIFVCVCIFVCLSAYLCMCKYLCECLVCVTLCTLCMGEKVQNVKNSKNLSHSEYCSQLNNFFCVCSPSTDTYMNQIWRL